MCKKGSNPIGKPFDNDTRVVCKITGGFAFRPTTSFMERQRQIKVIQAYIRFDVFGEQRIHAAIIKVQVVAK